MELDRVGQSALLGWSRGGWRMGVAWLGGRAWKGQGLWVGVQCGIVGGCSLGLDMGLEEGMVLVKLRERVGL